MDYPQFNLPLADNKKAYFISDIHLGSPFHENALETEKKLVSWLRSIQGECSYLFLVGDIFDYWFEYKNVVPKGYTRFLGQLSFMSDSGVEIHFFTGNHDIWEFGYLEKEVGLRVHRAPIKCRIEDKTFFIAHGDEFDFRSKSFRFIRAIFHNKLCQKLYAAIHPRWTVSFAHKWAESSRKKGLKKANQNHSTFFDEQEDYLVQWTKSYLNENPNSDIDIFIFGHTHSLIDLMLANNKRLIVLGDWLKHFSYAVWDNESLIVDVVDSDTNNIRENWSPIVTPNNR